MNITLMEERFRCLSAREKDVAICALWSRRVLPKDVRLGYPRRRVRTRNRSEVDRTES